MDTEIKLLGNGKGLIANWSFLAVFAAVVAGASIWAQNIKITLESHTIAIEKIDKKVDTLIEFRTQLLSKK